MESGQSNNARVSRKKAKCYEEMTPLQKAHADMMSAKNVGGFAYKQARKHYERLLREERRQCPKNTHR